MLQGGAKVGLQMFIWEIIQLINNNERINYVFFILITINLLLPHPVYLTQFKKHLRDTFYVAGLILDTEWFSINTY